MIPATFEDIKDWIKMAQNEKGTHLLVVCDEFSYEDYSVVVHKNEDVHKIYDKYHEKNMQRVIEVYNMSMDIDAQLKERLAKHFENDDLPS